MEGVLTAVPPPPPPPPHPVVAKCWDRGSCYCLAAPLPLVPNPLLDPAPDEAAAAAAALACCSTAPAQQVGAQLVGVSIED